MLLQPNNDKNKNLRKKKKREEGRKREKQKEKEAPIELAGEQYLWAVRIKHTNLQLIGPT